MPRIARLFSTLCLSSMTIAAGSCASTSRSRAAAKPQVMLSCPETEPQEVDSTVRFQREISSDSALAPGEIEGTVVSATTGAPVLWAEVSIEYPQHRHTMRRVFGDTEGRFRIKGLPDEDGIL